MTKQSETVEQVALRALQSVTFELPNKLPPGWIKFATALLSDPAVLELVPGVKELREENERLKEAVGQHGLETMMSLHTYRSRLHGLCIGREPSSAEEAAKQIKERLTSYKDRIASLEQQLAATEERSHHWHGEYMSVQSRSQAHPSIGVPEPVALAIMEAMRVLETEYRTQTRATEAQRVANATCAGSPGGASSIALLAESGYMHSLGKKNIAARDALFAVLRDYPVISAAPLSQEVGK